MKTRQFAVLPIVGPSGTLLWKRLARHVLAANSTPVTVDTADLLACIGLSGGLAKNSVGTRTIARLVGFDLARRAGRDGSLLAVRTALAPLTETKAARLPVTARRYHDHTTTGTTATAAVSRFKLGKLHVTPAAIAAMAAAHIDPAGLLDRHQRGDWGDVNVDEALANNDAVTTHALLHSIYPLNPAGGTVVWVLTESARTATTITTPDEC